MFKVIDMCGYIHDAYGTFVDEDGYIQFVLCDNDGEFYKTNTDIKDFYKLYKGEKTKKYNESIDSLENSFVREIKDKNITDELEILNWYRNLYYKETDGTERHTMAWAINNAFANYNVLDKQIAKEPVYSAYEDNGFGEIIPYEAVCPTCGYAFKFGEFNDEDNHHCVCGQRIDWNK